MDEKFETKGGRFRFAHYMVVIASVALTLGAWAISKRQSEQRIRERFIHESNQLVGQILDRMDKYADSLRAGVSAIYANNHDINFDQWNAFADALALETRYPGINGIGVVYYVKGSRLDEFLTAQRRRRPRFVVHPIRAKTEYWPITYINPVKVNKEAVGLDISHEENRIEAARLARDTGEQKITGPIILVQDETRTPGFLFYSPFYRPGELNGVEQKREKFEGLVYAPFVVSKLIYGTLKQETRMVDVKISDQGQTLYDEHVESNPDNDADPLYQRVVEREVYGRKWAFDLRSTKKFRASAVTNQPLIILLAGIIIDGLLIALFISMAKGKERALVLANKMEKEAQEQRSAAAHASKMAALGEMAGGIAHEINNPLTVILNYASLIKEIEKEGELQKEPGLLLDSVEKIEESIKRITTIVEGLRTFSRDGAKDKFETEDLNLVLKKAIEFGAERFKSKGLSLEFDSLPKTFVKCQKVQISQVIINLLNNARHAAEDSQEKWVRVELKKDTSQNLAKVYVRNSGRPIPAEVVEKLFEPFFTTKEAGEGTGLGLSISKGIVEAHDGRLYFDSNAKHTTFVVELPLLSLQKVAS